MEQIIVIVSGRNLICFKNIMVFHHLVYFYKTVTISYGNVFE